MVKHRERNVGSWLKGTAGQKWITREEVIGMKKRRQEDIAKGGDKGGCPWKGNKRHIKGRR